MSYTQLPTGTLGEKNMAFASFYTQGDPAANGEPLPKEKRGIGVPLVLMIMRWDGYIGFPGGMVEEGEDLVTGLRRELAEEINYIVPPSQLIPLCTHQAGNTGVHTHNFSCEVTRDEMFQILWNAPTAKHFLTEVQGCFAVQIANFGDDRGFVAFRKHQFRATAGLQLDVLRHRQGWLK